MAVYTIIRVYEVPAETRIQATERMLEALSDKVERDFHVKDYIRETGGKAGQGRVVDLRPSVERQILNLIYLTRLIMRLD